MSQRVLRVVLVCLVVGLVGGTVATFAFASSSKVVASRAAPAGATVWAGPGFLKGPPPSGLSKQAEALAFFPRAVTVAAGQPVTFQFAGFHTVTFAGGKAPAALIAPKKGAQPPLKDAAGQPLWWSGKAPLLGLNPAALLPQGSGTISSPSQVRNSGLLRILSAGPKTPPKPYTLTFLKPGLYRFFCVVHAGMHGLIRVVAAGTTVDSPDQITARATAQISGLIAEAKVVQAQNPAEKLTVWVGSGRLDGGHITSMFPRRLSVKVGETVKFVNHDSTDPHTVTFGPVPYTTQIEKTFVSPAGVNPFGAFPSEPPGPLMPIRYDGSNHGNGYVNSGLLNPYADKGQPPHLIRVTFLKPGIYRYECVIHPNMDGTISVR